MLSMFNTSETTLNPDGDLPQDSGVEIKCDSKYVTSKTVKTLLGISHDGWWTNDLMSAQLKQAIKIFEITHPGCIGVFLFDNSTGHWSQRLRSRRTHCAQDGISSWWEAAKDA